MWSMLEVTISTVWIGAWPVDVLTTIRWNQVTPIILELRAKGMLRK